MNFKGSWRTWIWRECTRSTQERLLLLGMKPTTLLSGNSVGMSQLMSPVYFQLLQTVSLPTTTKRKRWSLWHRFEDFLKLTQRTDPPTNKVPVFTEILQPTRSTKLIRNGYSKSYNMFFILTQPLWKATRNSLVAVVIQVCNKCFLLDKNK